MTSELTTVLELRKTFLKNWAIAPLIKNEENMTNQERIDKAIANIKSCYDWKYGDSDYVEFKELAANCKSKQALIVLVSNFFDLDSADARDMVE